MTLVVDLSGDEERVLAEAATAQGMRIDEYVRMALGLRSALGKKQAVAAWERALDELAEDVSQNVPPLSDEALSRRSIYGDRI